MQMNCIKKTYIFNRTFDIMINVINKKNLFERCKQRTLLMQIGNVNIVFTYINKKL